VTLRSGLNRQSVDSSFWDHVPTWQNLEKVHGAMGRAVSEDTVPVPFVVTLSQIRLESLVTVAALSYSGAFALYDEPPIFLDSLLV
jgi:hypothetical protein